MRHLLVVFALALLLPSPAFADVPQSVEQLQSPITAPNESDLATHDHYRNKDGEVVHSPSKSNTGKVPSGASAQCRDGSYSFSRHRSGTCSHHGGVDRWF